MPSMKTKGEHAIDATHAHTNINTWGAVIALLEGGLLYGPSCENDAASRVIRIAKAEQQKNLTKLDRSLDAVRAA